MEYKEGFTGELYKHYRLNEYGFGFIDGFIIMCESCDIMYYYFDEFEKIEIINNIEKDKIKKSFINTLKLANEYELLNIYLKKKSIENIFSKLNI